MTRPTRYVVEWEDSAKIARLLSERGVSPDDPYAMDHIDPPEMYSQRDALTLITAQRIGQKLADDGECGIQILERVQIRPDIVNDSEYGSLQIGWDFEYERLEWEPRYPVKVAR